MTTKVATFEKEKETKNTVKYQEALESGKPAVMGTLYLQKWFAGDTIHLTVTIEKEETK